MHRADALVRQRSTLRLGSPSVFLTASLLTLLHALTAPAQQRGKVEALDADPGIAVKSPAIVSRGRDDVLQRGVYEIVLTASPGRGNPYFDAALRVTLTRPDSSQVTVDGFYDGGLSFKARAYCDSVGRWSWRSAAANPSLAGKSGSFRVVPSALKGKLRRHPRDPRQFAYDNGQWFLHIGDTGYRYVTATEPKWQEYIDQAAQMGATKIRTWFCQARSDVQVLFADDRTALNLPYWQEIDRRVTYALEHHPHVMLQLIPYGEDTEELQRYGHGARASQLIARYAQARFSAFPNVIWCISNDREIVTHDKLRGRQVPAELIATIGRDMAAREPWGTLLTNHQSRFKGYSFVDRPWSDIMTIEDLDQVDGRVILEYRSKGDAPVVHDEDRYEHYRPPQHPRYFFRRLMWASLLSGGHATYGGAQTYAPYDGDLRGVQNYFDLARTGKLEGAHDFQNIHKFFAETKLTLVGMTPDDSLVGSNPSKYKGIHNREAHIIYLANPTGSEPETDAEADTVASVTVRLPEASSFTVTWFDPSDGNWKHAAEVPGNEQVLTAPGPGDWLLLLQSEGNSTAR
jgi:hypothetical protein